MSESRQRTWYCIANSHLDPVWLWRWPEGCAELRTTCRAAVEFLTNHRVLGFSRSSAGEMRWLVTMDPELVVQIRQLVRQGRWENVGGWWTQPDCNIPSGESFVRQALYGQQVFKQDFGAAAVVGYNVDSFGHHANLPQLLRQCGLHYYVFMRPVPEENADIPQGYFQWEGVDGSRVLTFHVFHPYNGSLLDLEHVVTQCQQHADATGDDGLMVFYGMGDHGGGPTREALERIQQYAVTADMPTFIHATPSTAFSAVARSGRELPIFRGELQHHASGCYAAHSEVKRMNRRAEEALLAAERMAVVATTLTGGPDLSRSLRSAWEDLLFSQFHDILAGTSVREAYVDTRDQLGRALFTAEEVLNMAQQTLAAQIDTRGEGQALVLFNPHAFPVRGLYETENIYAGGVHHALDLNRAVFRTDRDEELPVQHIRPLAHCGGLDRFLVPVDLPPLGYRLYRLAASDAPSAPTPRDVSVTEATVENALLRVTVASQGIAIYDKQRHRPVVSEAGIRALVIDDAGDTWGHDMLYYDQVAGTFALVGVRALEHGPLRGGLRAEYAFGRSRLWLDLLLDTGRRALEVRGKVWWLERQRLLKLAIPVNAATESATHEIPYAALERPNNGEEEPIQQWIDLSGPEAGLAVINAGKYSVSVVGNEIRQTILRSVPYAWSRCRAYPWPGQDIDWQDEDWMIDQGVEEFRLLVMVHDGDWRGADVMRAARLFNRRPAHILESAHGGTLATSYSFLQVAGADVRVEVVKHAEDGRGVIVRAVEAAGQGGSMSCVLPAMSVTWTADLAPWEIKTVRIVDGMVREELAIETSVSSDGLVDRRS